MAPNTWYTQRIDETLRQLSKTKTQINRISLLRVLLFVAGFAGLILFYRSGTWAVVLTVCCTFLPFFILVKVHNRLYFRREQLETQLKLNQDELKGLEGDYSVFDEGREFIDAGHPYSYDLDIFGRKSLFQALGRTCTHIGKQTLATWMQHHLTEKTAIETRQESIRDMSRRMEFREAFRVTGSINRGADSDEEEISRWSRTPSVLQHLWWVKLCLWAVPGINILLLALGLLHILSLSWFGMMFTVFVILSFGLIQRVTLIQESYGKKLKTLNRYARLITLAKGETWQAPALRELTDKLDIDGHSPAEALTQLSKELDRLDLRNNQLLYVILEGSMFFQLRQIVRIERWKARYGKYLMGWLEAVGELDALCSLGTFAYNHPAYTYPTIAGQSFCFLARNMGHPLMPEAQCVKNDATIPSRPYFLIITGANMAGKRKPDTLPGTTHHQPAHHRLTLGQRILFLCRTETPETHHRPAGRRTGTFYHPRRDTERDELSRQAERLARPYPPVHAPESRRHHRHPRPAIGHTCRPVPRIYPQLLLRSRHQG